MTWQPQIEGNPGSHFYVQFRKTQETQFLSSEEELNGDSIVIRGLDPDVEYDFRVSMSYNCLSSLMTDG